MREEPLVYNGTNLCVWATPLLLVLMVVMVMVAG